MPNRFNTILRNGLITGVVYVVKRFGQTPNGYVPHVELAQDMANKPVSTPSVKIDPHENHKLANQVLQTTKKVMSSRHKNLEQRWEQLGSAGPLY